MTLILTSPVISNNGSIPIQYTCEGHDISPPLAWSDVPKGAKSFALIMDDPDAPDPNAPKMTYVHWVLYNIPGSTNQLPEDSNNAMLPAGILHGKNDWHKTGYGGPCPPIGKHRYFFKLYALDTILPDLHEPSKKELETAMKDHILEKSELIGTYKKSKN